jgi:hypothetical protein
MLKHDLQAFFGVKSQLSRLYMDADFYAKEKVFCFLCATESVDEQNQTFFSHSDRAL